MDDKFYLEGAGIDGFNVELPNDANSDPCKGYIPTVNDPTYVHNPNDPDDKLTITFPYDRETAADYGIVQSYNNNTAQRDIARVNMPTTPPFAFFIQGGITHQSGLTGSSVFTSEAIWMGGMPMTNSGADFPARDLGWWHTGEGPQDSWTQHRHIIRYFTEDLSYLSKGSYLIEGINQILVGERGSVLPDTIRDPDTRLPINPGGDSNGGFYTSISRSDFAEGDYISADSLLVGKLLASSQEVSEFVQCQIARNTLDDWDDSQICNQDLTRLPEAGDYVLIDSWITEDGSRKESAHGLLVVGWAKTQNCDHALATTYSFSASNPNERLYLTLADAGGFGSDVVPYVADFSHGAGGTGQTQSEIARPFYCTMYNETSGFAGFGFEGKFSDHEWWFYSLPESAEINASSLYVNPDWSWEN
jgi:hypothetical protein